MLDRDHPRISQRRQCQLLGISRLGLYYQAGIYYRGVAKNQFAAFMESICFNLKRLVALNVQDLRLL